MFGFKKRHVELVLPKNPEENRPPEKTDDEINKVAVNNVALGPAATEEDIRNYSQGNVAGSPSSYYGMLNGQQSNQEQTQTQANEIFVPFIPDGVISNESPYNSSSNQNQETTSEIIYLKRKVDELMDKIYLLERKIDTLERKDNY